MNLADALRRVNSETGVRSPGEMVATPQSEKVARSKEPKALNSDASGTDPGHFPSEPSHSVQSGNVVRLELFLSAEQMGGLFRAIMAGQHTVLTVREAAAYLRISQDSLVGLAEEGEIPGVLIEGRWRFPKPSLDDWLTRQSVGHEDNEDVA